MIIKTLHREGKPQKVMAGEAGCAAAVLKHIDKKLKSVVGKVAQTTEAGVRPSRATANRYPQERGCNCQS